jgi:hypothetical protein
VDKKIQIIFCRSNPPVTFGALLEKAQPIKRFYKKFFWRVAKINTSITFALPFEGRMLNRKDSAGKSDLVG